MRNNKLVVASALCLFLSFPGWAEQGISLRLGPGGRSYSFEFSEPQLLFQTLAEGSTSVLEVSLRSETGGFLRLQEERFYQGTLTLGYDVFLQVWTLEISHQFPITRGSGSPRLEFFDQQALVLERLKNIDLPSAVPSLRGRIEGDEQIVLEARFYDRPLDPALWVLRPFLWGRVGVSRQVMREVP